MSFQMSMTMDPEAWSLRLERPAVAVTFISTNRARKEPHDQLLSRPPSRPFREIELERKVADLERALYRADYGNAENMDLRFEGVNAGEKMHRRAGEKMLPLSPSKFQPHRTCGAPRSGSTISDSAMSGISA